MMFLKKYFSNSYTFPTIKAKRNVDIFALKSWILFTNMKIIV